MEFVCDDCEKEARGYPWADNSGLHIEQPSGWEYLGFYAVTSEGKIHGYLCPKCSTQCTKHRKRREP